MKKVKGSERDRDEVTTVDLLVKVYIGENYAIASQPSRSVLIIRFGWFGKGKFFVKSPPTYSSNTLVSRPLASFPSTLKFILICECISRDIRSVSSRASSRMIRYISPRRLNFFYEPLFFTFYREINIYESRKYDMTKCCLYSPPRPCRLTDSIRFYETSVYHRFSRVFTDILS